MKLLLIVNIISLLFLFSCKNNDIDKMLNEKPLLEMPLGNYLVRELDSLNLYQLQRLTFDKKGNIYLLDAKNFRVCILDTSYKLIRTIGRKGNGPGEFYFEPRDIVVAFNRIYILIDYELNIFDIDGNFLKRHRINSSISNLVINEKDSLLYYSTIVLKENYNEKIDAFYIRDINGDSIKTVKINNKDIKKIRMQNFSESKISLVNNYIVFNINEQDEFHLYDLQGNYLRKVEINSIDYKLKNSDKDKFFYYTQRNMINLSNGIYGVITNTNMKNRTMIDLFDKELKQKGKIYLRENFPKDYLSISDLKIHKNDAYIIPNELGNKDLYKIPNFKQKIDNLLKD